MLTFFERVFLPKCLDFFLVISSLEVHEMDGSFSAKTHIPFSWTHFVLNYIGPQDGIQVFGNGTLLDEDTSKTESQRTQQESRVAVGKRYTNYNGLGFSSIKVDELLFFNTTLSSGDIVNLYNMTF